MEAIVLGKAPKVADPSQPDITGMLVAWNAGDAAALDRLIEVVYPQLLQMAHKHLRGRRSGDSVESGTLANEAYLKLVRAGSIQCENRVHFLAVCAQVMRRILVDHARKRGFEKRGGKVQRVPLDQALILAEAQGVDVLALDEALGELGRIDRRKSRVVELRYFGGLSLQEVAQVLEVSLETVKRDWRLARAWLVSELGARCGAGGGH